MTRRRDDLDQHFRQLYTAEAARYDRVRFDHPSGRFFNAREQTYILSLLGLRAGQSVLDVAAGTGRIAVFLRREGLAVTALDLTRAMLTQAQARVEQEQVDGVRFVEANGRRLPFAEGAFDGAISIRFLHLLPVNEYRSFVQEMWRIVKPGGVLLLELDSALSGGGLVTWGREIVRRLRGHKPRFYVWPSQIGEIFDEIENLTLHGFSVAGAKWLYRVSPRGGEAVERWFANGGRSFLANRVFVRAVKARS